jgi:hypothetical protein
MIIKIFIILLFFSRNEMKIKCDGYCTLLFFGEYFGNILGAKNVKHIFNIIFKYNLKYFE